MTMMIKTKDLKLADTVQLFYDAFGTAVVTQISDEAVTLFRPYATTADFSYTGGVVPFIGMETVTLPRNDTYEVSVLARKVLK